jgi:hypothetical protein
LSRFTDSVRNAAKPSDSTHGFRRYTSPLEKVDVFRNHPAVMNGNKTLRERILDGNVEVFLHLDFRPLGPNFINQEHGIVQLFVAEGISDQAEKKK